MALVTLASACQDDKYVANVTELSLVRMDPESGYSGAIVKVLGRNFSEKAKDNVVLIGGKEAKVLDANKWDLTIVVPENDPAEYEVEVTTPAGKAGISCFHLCRTGRQEWCAGRYGSFRNVLFSGRYHPYRRR